MSEYKVESGIPIPPRGSGRINGGHAKTRSKYPFHRMRVKDSFYIKPGDKDARHVQMAAMVAAAKFKRMRFTTRANKKHAVRVWREE